MAIGRLWQRHGRRVGAGMVAIVLSAMLAACLLMPGKFVSNLDVRRDGAFTFRYTGGITLLPLALPHDKATFTPATCYADDGTDERPCTPAELATQRAEFDKQQAEKTKSDAQAAQVLFGGVDPTDPKAAEEIATRLRRQKGWKRVDYKGSGLFDVDFEMRGRLDHDFAFPTVERFPMANAFVQISLRDDGTVRIDAPGFAPATSGAAAAGLMQGTMLKEAETAPVSTADGIFTLTTDAEVLANNTDEGPRKGATGGQELSWVVNPRTPAPPMALLRLKPSADRR